jgi:hypothetical protein
LFDVLYDGFSFPGVAFLCSEQARNKLLFEALPTWKNTIFEFLKETLAF